MSGSVIITGAAGGLGFAIAEAILKCPEPYTYIFTVRDKSAPNAKPLYDLIASSGKSKQATVSELDLSSLDCVRRFATDVSNNITSGKLPPIRALILNAAAIVLEGPLKFTQDGGHGKGFEINFAVNYLANFLLTLSLLGSMDRVHGRIVYISSWKHKTTLPISPDNKSPSPSWDPEELSHPKEQAGHGAEVRSSKGRYGMSKLCLVMFMHALQKRLNVTPGLNQICVLGIDPGAMIHPNMVGKVSVSAPVKYVLVPALQAYTRLSLHLCPNGSFRTVEKSASDVVRAALQLDDPDLGEYPRDVYLNGSEIVESAASSMDETDQRKLWEASLKYANLDEIKTALSGT